METQILILSGKQGSGKTTTGNLIQKTLIDRGFAVGMVSFAAPLYRMHNMCREYLQSLGIEFSPEVKVKDGRLLQLLGKEWGRDTISQDVWIKAARGYMQKIADEARDAGADRCVMIITDCRFKNEFDGFKDALRVRLECARSIRKERAEMWRDTDMHASEIDLDDYVTGGHFDLVFNSQLFDAQYIASNIIAHLDAGDWIANRHSILK